MVSLKTKRRSAHDGSRNRGRRRPPQGNDTKCATRKADETRQEKKKKKKKKKQAPERSEDRRGKGKGGGAFQ
jgi:hypothetical protein